MTEIFRITDGTETVNLNDENGWIREDWTVGVPQAKSGGVWQESALSDGRRLVTRQLENINESILLKCGNQADQDTAIVELQRLERLLEKAVQYWTTDWQNDPVWIEARAKCETNMRYAIIHQYSIPGLESWFNQPFAADPVVIDNVTLNLEHGIWIDNEPGTGDAAIISGEKENCDICFARFIKSAITQSVDCGSNALVDDLPDGNDLTWESWVRAHELGTQMWIMEKGNAPVAGWTIFINANGLLGVRVTYDSAVASYDSETVPLNDWGWHHIAVVWDESNKEIFVYVDGNTIPHTKTNGAGNYVSDAGFNLLIGNNWIGDIGWTRISDTQRYTAEGFTPPVRCTLPAIDGNTVGQWIGAECTGTNIDNQEGTAALDGSTTGDGVHFNCECNETTTNGQDKTELANVFVSNRENYAPLTHVYIDSGGVFGGNLIGAATPFDLIPAAAGHLYIGSERGQFSNVIFDISNPLHSGGTWQYYDGAAWSALNPDDNTLSFSISGVRSVVFDQPSDWSTVAVNGTTAFWIRQSVGGLASPPQQQNRDIYTVNWSNLKIEDSDVGGDYPALLEAQHYNQGPDTVHRALVGLRSLSRGENFSAILPVSDEQMPYGVTIIESSATTAFADDNEASTGRSWRYNVASSALTYRFGFAFDENTIDEYFGRYRAFLVFSVDTGTNDDIGIQIYWHPERGSTTGAIEISDLVLVEFANEWQALDLGTIKIPETPGSLSGDDVSADGEIAVYISNDSSADVRFFRMHIVPVDEFAAEAINFNGNMGIENTDHYLSIDSLLSPKRLIRSLKKETDDDAAISSWTTIANGPIVFQANADQRLWWFIMRSISAGTTEWRAENSLTGKVVVNKAQRYLSARGNR